MKYTDPSGMYIVGTDGRPVTYDAKNGWSANASADVQKIGNVMMRTPEGQKVFNAMKSTEYGISMNYKEGRHLTDKNKLGETVTNFDTKTKKINSMEVNLYDGKIQENVTMYEKLNQGYILENPTPKNNLLIKQQPTLTERIGQVGVHEGTHATDPKAMVIRGNTAVEAEKVAVASETKAIQQTLRPIPIDLSSIRINIR